ncbi:piggyBac transposable element-derived protein 4-like, partial [Myzus persicae]|uniref:piggyBac transposable element-derived protein 4-like n=1 Tax=Myzus persicae TaxID=13164 RepID=UPI000B935E89
MKDIYEASENLSLDESMVLYRGRLVFRQYIKNKRHKYGIKLYMLTESGGLGHRIMIYSGQGQDTSTDFTHTEYVVVKLMEGLTDCGRSLYMDNYYNSVKLAHTLLAKRTYCTGTLRANRKGNPKEITSKKLKVGESVGKYTKEEMSLVKSHININVPPALPPKITNSHFPTKVAKNEKKNFIEKDARYAIQKAYEKQQYSTVPVVKVNLVYASKTVLKFITHNL